MMHSLYKLGFKDVVPLFIFLLTVAELLSSLSADELMADISVSGFRSGIHHWRKIRDPRRLIVPNPDQGSYADTDVRSIAANLLLYQRADGGWPKDYDMLAILDDRQRAIIQASRDQQDSSFDNDNIHSQITYLAHAYNLTHDETYRRACEMGLDYVTRAQYPSGGFPQHFPGAEGYHARITFNDGVMIGNLTLLLEATTQGSHFAWLDEERRRRAKDGLDRGVDCVLKCQIRVSNRLTGWCQQHDESTFAAAAGRTFELASICPQETTQVVQFLKRLPVRSAVIEDAANQAIAWLKEVQIRGIAVERVPVARVQFERHDADFDVVVRQDPRAPAIWARHYEIGTNRPVFAGRDGIPKYALAEIEQERRTGTPWYGTWPSRLDEVSDDSSDK